MVDAPEIWTGRANDDVVAAVHRMFDAVGNPKPLGQLRWQYLGPEGGAYVAIAHDSRGIADGAGALYAAFPTRMRAGDRSFIGAQSFDTLTLPDYRGQGWFPRLADRVFAALDDDDVQLVYGFPNEASTPGFVKKLGWSLISDAPMLIRPVGLRYARVKAGLRHVDGGRVEEAGSRASKVACVSRIPDDLDYMADGSGDEIQVVRDAAYLAWRLGRPGATYAMYESRTHGKIVAFGVVRVTEKHGCNLGYIMEMMASSEGDARSLCRAMVADLKGAGADLIFAWASPGTPARRALGRSGFMVWPQRIRPIKLYFGARHFGDPASRDADSPQGWRLSYLDSDTV